MSKPQPRPIQTALSKATKKFTALFFCGSLLAGTLCGLEALTTESPVAGEDSNAQTSEINKPVTDKWALVVGISKFKDPNLNLRYPAKDARDFYNYLISQGNFAKDHVRLVLDENATRDRILDLLGDSWLPRVSLPDDLVVIFISSHGSSSQADIRGINYVVAHDTNPEKLFTTGLAMQHLADTIKERVHSDRVLVILDTCHAGGAKGESKGLMRSGNADAQQIAQGTGQMVICSSDRDQVSWESKDYPNSVFTRSLIESFAQNGKTASVQDVFEKTKERVQEEVVKDRGVMQTPVLESSKWSGKGIVLAALPTRPRKGLPDIEEIQARSQNSQSTSPVTPTIATTSKAGSGYQNFPTPQKPIYQPPVQKPVATSGQPGNTGNTNASGLPWARIASQASPMDFMRFHFNLVANRDYKGAWDDLGPGYRRKFQNNSAAYQSSVSRHKWRNPNAPDNEFKALPLQGNSLKIRVRMLNIAGYNAVWVYTLKIINGAYFIDDVATSSLPLNSDSAN
jgi:hypothetical protein